MNTQQTIREFGAVILAAGYSSRMKAFKPLLPIGNLTALETLLAAVKSAGIENIAVVTGHNRAQALPVIKKADVLEAYNADYDNGMFSSIQAGLRYAKDQFPQMSGCFLMPVDCPLIGSSILERLMEAASTEAIDGGPAAGTGSLSIQNFYVPVFEGKKGHPLLIPSEYVDEICSYDGPGGLKTITDRHWDRLIRIPVEDEGCLLDMDTPEGYEEILVFRNAGGRREGLQKLAAGRRIVLIRHGETRQHREKMFIGRYDVPLKEDAHSQVEVMAEKLAEQLKEGPAKRPESKFSGASERSVLYTSPLQRAAQTAEIIGRVLGKEPHQVADLQEIALGDWDGKPIREIREQYPAEYERRGADLFSFKIGNKAENFYDVQYRAVKALRRILQEDASHDIILVTHSAVIRALENNLKGLRVDDPWEPLAKNDFRIIEL